MSYGCNEIFNIKKQYRFKASFGEDFRISFFTDKKVRLDNNVNYAKNTCHVKPISNVANVTLQIIAQ